MAVLNKIFPDIHKVDIISLTFEYHHLCGGFTWVSSQAQPQPLSQREGGENKMQRAQGLR